MRVVLQFWTIRNSTVAINDRWLLLKPELLWLLIVNALQLNELSALRNTFYPENKYVCTYVCMQDDFWTCKVEIFFFPSLGIYFIWPESLGIIYFLLIISWGKTLTLTLTPIITLVFFAFSPPTLKTPPPPPIPHHFSDSPSQKFYFRAVQSSIVYGSIDYELTL